MDENDPMGMDCEGKTAPFGIFSSKFYEGWMKRCRRGGSKGRAREPRERGRASDVAREGLGAGGRMRESRARGRARDAGRRASDVARGLPPYA